MNTIKVTNPNFKLVTYFGNPIKVTKAGPRIDGWQPHFATFLLPEGWTPVVPPTKDQHGDELHATGPDGAYVTTTASGMTNLNTP